MQEYEKQLRKVKAPLCTAKAQEKSGAAHHTHNMLNGSYSKTFIFTSQYPGKPTGKKVIKYSFIECSRNLYPCLLRLFLIFLLYPSLTWTTSWRMTGARGPCPPVTRCFPRPRPPLCPRPPRHSTPRMRISRQSPWTT